MWRDLFAIEWIIGEMLVLCALNTDYFCELLLDECRHLRRTRWVMTLIMFFCCLVVSMLWPLMLSRALYQLMINLIDRLEK